MRSQRPTSLAIGQAARFWKATQLRRPAGPALARRFSPARWAALAVTVFVLATACDTTQPSSTPAQSATSSGTVASPEPQLSAAEVARAKEFRVLFGLRSDEVWIRQVAADPASLRGLAEFGIPLSQAEVSALESRSTDQDAIKALVLAVAKADPNGYAGMYIDQQRGGLLVAQFSANFEQHRAELMAQVGPKAKFEVRAVRWSLLELEAAVARLDADHDWFGTIPAKAIGWGIQDSANRVVIRISSVVPNAEALVLAHYAFEEIATVESDGTGALLLPFGSLRIIARKANGDPVPGLSCRPTPDLPGALDDGVLRPNTDAAGVCFFPAVPATGYWIFLTAGSGPSVTVAFGRAVVDKGKTAIVTIVVP
jgi:hypothetical protein